MDNFYTNVSRSKNQILFRGYIDGERVDKAIDYSPHFFVSAKTQTPYVSFKTGKFLDKLVPGTISQCYEFLQTYDEVDNFEICGNPKFEQQFIQQIFPTRTIEWNKDKIRIFDIDIEVASEVGFPTIEDTNEEVLVISVFDYLTGKLSVFPKKSFVLHKEFYDKIKNHFKNVPNFEIVVHNCETEIELLETFLEFWTHNHPDIITGWNVRFFDIPYLYNRIKKLFDKKVANSLSVWGITSTDTVDKWGKEHSIMNLVGTSILDYMEMYRKYTPTNQESYRLDYIAEIELGRQKLSYKEHDSLREFYTNDWNKFVEYNICDVELVHALDYKLKLIELHLSVAYYAKINYQDVFSQVKTWEAILRNAYEEKGIICPLNKEVGEKTQDYEGAYVKQPILGFHDWVVSFDLNSLYPSLIIQNNIGPETIIDEENYDKELRTWILENDFSLENILSQNLDTSILKKKNLCMAANRQFFRKDKESILVNIVKELYNARKQEKKKMLECQSMIAQIEKELETRK